MSDVLRVIPRAGAFDIGNARITVFPTSHDATESIDFRVDHGGAGVGILTDTGFVTPEAEQTLAGVDLMVLESNHDEESVSYTHLDVYKRQAAPCGSCSWS